MKKFSRKNQYNEERTKFKQNLYQIYIEPDDFTETFEDINDIAFNQKPKLVAVYTISHFEVITREEPKLKRTKI